MTGFQREQWEWEYTQPVGGQTDDSMYQDLVDTHAAYNLTDARDIVDTEQAALEVGEDKARQLRAELTKRRQWRARHRIT